MPARTWGKALQYAYQVSRAVNGGQVTVWVRPSAPNQVVQYAAAIAGYRWLLKAAGYRELSKVRAIAV